MTTTRELLDGLRTRPTGDDLRAALDEAERRHPDDADAAFFAYTQTVLSDNRLHRAFLHRVLQGGGLEVTIRWPEGDEESMTLVDFQRDDEERP
jgi:hypothetical protein